MLFEYVCSTWSVFELKTRFEKWITRNDINGVSLFHFSYLITLMASLSSQRTLNVQIKFFMFDRSIYISFVPNTCWKQESLQIIIFVKVCSTWRIVELKMSFEKWIRRNDVNGISLFHLFYLLTLMAYLWSQRSPN
jgi:hypothetical protein